MNRIIIFDLDGTLIDSSLNITNAINFTRSHLDLSPLNVDFVVKNINSNGVNLAKIFYETENFTQTQTKHFEEHYLDCCTHNLQAYQGICESLQSLKNENYSLSVATNGASKFAKKMLEYLKIDHFFDHIVGHDDVEHPKPNPQMLQKIISSYANLQDKQPIMIGDSIKDILAAKAANSLGVYVKWGFGEDITDYDLAFSHPTELSQLSQFLKDSN